MSARLRRVPTRADLEAAEPDHEPQPARWLPWLTKRSFDGHDQHYIGEQWTTVVAWLVVGLATFAALLLRDLISWGG